MQRLIQFLLPYFSIDASKETGRLGRLVNHGKKNERNASMKEFKGQLVLFAIRYISINILMVFNFCKACLHHFLFYGFILLHVISFTFKFSLSEKLKKTLPIVFKLHLLYHCHQKYWSSGNMKSLGSFLACIQRIISRAIPLTLMSVLA